MHGQDFWFLKFIYSEKATKFCEIFPLLLTTVHTVKSKISQNFVAFSEYMNFDYKCMNLELKILGSWVTFPLKIVHFAKGVLVLLTTFFASFQKQTL